MCPNIAKVLVIASALHSGCASAVLAQTSATDVSALSGGGTTREATNRMAFSLPAANMHKRDLRRFFLGNRLFNTSWVTAPASVKSFDGLGPLYNRVSCSGCHVRDGRGRPPTESGGALDSMLVRLSVPGRNRHGGPVPLKNYGDQLNDRAIPRVRPEGQVMITYTEEPGTFDDGTRYSLRRPAYKINNPGYGPLPAGVLLSPRVAPAVFGLGLLEAVPEAIVRAAADPEDRDADGISGRVNVVWDQAAQAARLGRFGWKANQPNLKQQGAGALNGDIGITTSLFPDQNCMPTQVECLAGITGGTPELSDEFLNKLEFYMQSLAVPARRDLDDPEVRQGERLFKVAGCTACHTPIMSTRHHPNGLLANQRIQPFTDLLLHDMGAGLADGRPDFEATGTEWRTQPLWGIGLQETVNGHTNFLHDGRARNLTEAILWHGGEGAAARNRFKKMAAENRAALIRFLNSL